MKISTKLTAAVAGAGVILAALPASAQLEAYKDYDISESTSILTTVKVKSNMMDYYLEGLKDTWVAGNEIAKSLGHIEDYSIHASQLPASGDFNLVLVVRFANTGDIGPSKARYDAFMAEWGQRRQAQTRETVKTYPEYRKITGDYLMNEITIK